MKKCVGIIIIQFLLLFYLEVDGLNKYLFLFTYLYIVSEIDRKTMQVYSFINWIAGGVGIVSFLSEVPKLKHIEFVFCCLFLYGRFVIIQKMFKLYGAGDGDVFLVLMFYLYNIGGDFPLYNLFLHNFLSLFILFLLNIRNINFPSLKLRERVPFVPYIYLATWIVFLVGWLQNNVGFT